VSRKHEFLFDSLYLDKIEFEHPEIWGSRSDRQRKVFKIIDKELSVKQKNCINMYYFECLTQEVIACQLQVSVRTVRTHLDRGVAKIKEKLEGK
jgi:RNA polymerase sigma factor (sigma-70 family)